MKINFCYDIYKALHPECYFTPLRVLQEIEKEDGDEDFMKLIIGNPPFKVNEPC